MNSVAPNADGVHVTYCRLCEAQCGLLATVADGRIVHVGPDRDHVTSSGHLCVKGPGMMHVTHDPDRVLTPLKRVGAPGEFVQVSWNEALDDIAARLEAILAQTGGDSMGLYFGNPSSFGFRHMAYASKFARQFGSGKIYNPVHVDTGAKSLGCTLVYGPGHPYTFPDLEDCDFLLMLGANPMVSHMSLISEPRALQQLEAVARRGAVVVVDPRLSETARRFEHLQVLPDSDMWLLGAMLRILFEEGLAKEDLLDARISGWREFRAGVCEIDLDQAAARCRVPLEEIRNVARRFAAARTAACYGRIGTNRGSFPTLTNVFIEAMNLVTGRFGQRGGWITGASAFAGRPTTRPAENGAGPLPPYGAARSRIGGLPMISGFQPGGSLADDILTPGEGQLRALFVDSGNPVMAYPGSGKTAQALDQLELFVALDFYVTESTKYADYILPTTTFFERADLNDIFSVNAPRPWLQFVDAVIDPQGESRLELDIYNDLLVRMGREPMFVSETGANSAAAGLIEIMDDMLVKSPVGAALGGLSVERMRNEFPSGVRHAESADAEGSWDRVTHGGGRPWLWGEVIAAEMARLIASQAEPQDGRLKLFGRRKLRSLNSWMHNDLRIVRSDLPTLLMHPGDARARGIEDGAMVRIVSDSGEIEVVVEISDEVIAGSVSYPHGWGHSGGWRVANGLPGRNVNELASSNPADWEQVSGMCLIDGIPVEVSPVAYAALLAATG